VHVNLLRTDFNGKVQHDPCVARKDEMMINQPDPGVAAYAQSEEVGSSDAETVALRTATTSGSHGESRQTDYKE